MQNVNLASLKSKLNFRFTNKSKLLKAKLIDIPYSKDTKPTTLSQKSNSLKTEVKISFHNVKLFYLKSN